MFSPFDLCRPPAVDPAFDQPDPLEGAEEEDPESLCSAPVGPTEADNKCQVSRRPPTDQT